MGEGFGKWVEFIEIAIAGRYPDVPFFVFNDVANDVTADTACIIRIGSENGDGMPVVAIQPIEGAKPHEAMAVLQDGQYLIAR